MTTFYMSELSTNDVKRRLGDIYTQYMNIAFRAAIRISNNWAMAEDAVHNGFMQIIKDWDKFLQLPYDKQRSRIVIIVKNKMIDLVRKEKYQVPFDEIEEYTECVNYDLITMFERIEDAQILRECVAKLPEIYKTVLELRYFHEMSNAEIAETLGIEPNNVGVRIFRAIEFLTKIVKEGKKNATEGY